MLLFKRFTRIFLLTVITLLITSTSIAQLSKTHYIPPLTSAGFGNANPEEQYFYISTPSTVDVAYTIKSVGLSSSFDITGVVSKTNPQEVFLDSGYGQLFITSISTSQVIDNRGYIIEADDVIYVSARMIAGGGAQAGALVSKGLNALGKKFRIGSYTNENASNNYLNFVTVMATEDGTTDVTFSDLPAGLIIKNYSGTTPVNTTLNKGESYTIATNSSDTAINKDGLIGCLVTATKNVVVNCGSANGSFSNGTGRDYGIDQIVDLSKVGTEYIFVKGAGSDEWENVLLVAHSNNTEIYINGNTTAETTINAGDYYLIEGDQYNTSGNMYVETSEPVFAYQGVGATSSEANQGMFFVPPLSCETRGNLDYIPNIDKIGGTTFSGGVTIVTKVGATVTINNLPLTSFSTLGDGSNNVDGNTDYTAYKVTGLSGDISVQCDDELYCAYFNENSSATSGSFYSGFPSAPEINFNADFTTLGNCIDNISLEAANMGSFDSIEWYYDDGTGFIPTGNTTSIIEPTFPADGPFSSGTYKLIGITCTGESIPSLDVLVSICPDDIDEDGIIDNLDIDNDNDGILNCTESYGTENLNLSNLNNGNLTIGGFNFVGTTTNIGNVATIPLTGAADGTFLSDLPAKTASLETSINYNLSFNNELNLLFEYATSGSGIITDEEEFIIQVPNDRTITLLDPDNQLAIDTNYDGVYETGITQYSAFEIRFKLNSTSLPLGTGTFSFNANKVNSITYTHKNTSEINSNQAAFKISATCIPKDTDLDGIEDALDYDSDNDGIPDSIENQGIITTLSGIDADINGLDDVFDITSTPIDTDTDGIWDFYDLDSDNDGITDLIETGQLGLLSDTDLNGIIDWLDPTDTNGWDNNAETSPDSGVIIYTLNDLDTDSIFSYIDSDSDGDSCNDTIEAGFTDANKDNFIDGTGVDSNGLVIGSDGYTLPNSDYITIAPITITTQPTAQISCELNTTLFTIETNTIDNYQWQVSTDNGVSWNDIVDDSFYQNSTTNELTILNTPLTFNTYKYRVFLNTAGNTCGLISNEVLLTVNITPIANTAPAMILCDNDNNGTMPFDLTLQNSFINTVSGMTITYHNSQANADAGSPSITGPFESGNTTVFARVENDLNTTCFDTSSFDLLVYESAFPLNASAITNLSYCDDTSFGTDTDGYIMFDLTERATEILNTQAATDFTLTYFLDSGYTSEITTPATFKNTISGGQTIYVRMTNNLESTCYTDTSFLIEVFTLPTVNIPAIYLQCDDMSNDGLAFFNLTLNSIKEEIQPNYIAEGLLFSYYQNEADAQLGNSATIVNPLNYENTTPHLQEILWIRVETPNGCFRVVSLTIGVTPSSAALETYVPSPIIECDNGTDTRDGIATFDLTSLYDYISNTIFPTVNVTVHFYEIQMDAELENNEILNITNHQNTTSINSQNIWVRVKSNLGNNCLGLKEFPNLLIVEALPTANPVTISRQCDDDDDGMFPFDTSLVEPTVLNGQTGVSVNYIDELGNPLPSPLPNPFLTSNQTITIRISNNTPNACFEETPLEFIVDKSPVANPVTITPVCDDETNDGVYDFDTSTIESTLLGAQIGMEVHYYDSLGTELSSPLPNPFTSTTQTINIEVINPLNTICTATTTIDFIVNPLPDFNVESPKIICLTIPASIITLDVSQDNISEVLDYEWRNKLDLSTILSTGKTLDVNQDGIYQVKLTKTDGTNCFRTKEIEVNNSEIPKINLDAITIEDDTDNNTITINIDNLGVGNYEFSIDDEFFGYQDEPFFDFVVPGIHTLYIRDKNFCGTSKIEIPVIGYPKFFTPNNDGINDTWKVLGVDENFYTSSTIYIFDRYGKLITQIDPKGNGWDGIFNGAMLPSTDYWFSAELIDHNGISKIRKGHFSLIRR